MLAVRTYFVMMHRALHSMRHPSQGKLAGLYYSSRTVSPIKQQQICSFWKMCTCYSSHSLMFFLTNNYLDWNVSTGTLFKSWQPQLLAFSWADVNSSWAWPSKSSHWLTARPRTPVKRSVQGAALAAAPTVSSGRAEVSRRYLLSQVANLTFQSV